MDASYASRAWRPTRYRYRLWGCEMGIRFRVVKLRQKPGPDLLCVAVPVDRFGLGHS